MWAKRATDMIRRDSLQSEHTDPHPVFLPYRQSRYAEGPQGRSVPLGFSNKRCVHAPVLMAASLTLVWVKVSLSVRYNFALRLIESPVALERRRDAREGLSPLTKCLTLLSMVA